MIDSHLDSDRLHSVAHRLARWSVEEAAHLERCAECRLEWEIVRTARTLGRSPAERVDAARVVAIVGRRLASEPASNPGTAPRAGRRVAIGFAAAAAIALVVFFPRGTTSSEGVAPAAEIAVLHELDGLTPAELEAVLETIPPAADEALHVEAAPIGDLSEKDLERMLQSME